MNKISNDTEFQRRLVMYLDGALSKEEAREFLDTIMKSPDQMSQLQKEKSFREFLRQKVGRRTVSQALIQSIKTKITDSTSSSS